MACMNASCGVSTASNWKKGWPLRSGGYANLCDKCGSAYEQAVFCDVFHSNESGWRECASCHKQLHCGCIASRFLLDLLDGGGVKCQNCVKNSELRSIPTDERLDGCGLSKAKEMQPTSTDSQIDGSSVDKSESMYLGNDMGVNGLRPFFQSQNDKVSESVQKMKQEELPSSMGEIGSTCFSNINMTSNGSCEAAKAELYKANMRTNDMYESMPHTTLSIAIGSSLGNSNPYNGVMVDRREHNDTLTPFLHGTRSRHVLPKNPRSAFATGLEVSTGTASQIRVARPPTEVRGKNQLLPRYWPRITDQELQQISGDSNSTIVPLFEKMLSASDAGRIGRLVLPKACAEAYFPPISQPEGLPLKIQDIKGKEWLFQFRFWPNNNSRMYVLEGVTPCIQSMQLQAGDTVTFSRMDPEGKLIMGFRKASNSMALQDIHPSGIHNAPHSSETFFSAVFENLPIISGYSGLLQSFKGGTGTQLNAMQKHLTQKSADVSWNKTGKNEGRTREDLLLSSLLIPERKRARNIGSKSKRLHIDSQDALELKLTWEEAQDLLRPPPAVKPSILMIEDHEFEEYEEPPVFGKRSIFIVRSTGEKEQWAQCDSCSKWRRLPVDILLPSKWICMDNNWDHSRCSCSAPDELTPTELESLLEMNKELKKHRSTSNHKPTLERESSGLDALANAAILGDLEANQGTTSVATTTKHPRHRPGCSCIVCIQPPSGKGKHKPTCTCIVCMTVKRRFKTLMMNKKKRQSEREAEIAQRNQPTWSFRDEAEAESTSKHVSAPLDPSENEVRSANELESKSQRKSAETVKKKLDLNCHPVRAEELLTGSNHISMMRLLEVANRPLETYLKQNGLASLVQEQQTNSSSHKLPQVTNESEGQIDEDHCLVSVAQDQDSGDEEQCEPHHNQNDPPQ